MNTSTVNNRPEAWTAEYCLSLDQAKQIVERQHIIVRSIRLIGEGWDNIAYEINRNWIFRFPRRAVALEGVKAEIAILPKLAERLPIPIPIPKHVGQLEEHHNWPFFGYKKLSGQESCAYQLQAEQRTKLIEPIARFLQALHAKENYHSWQQYLRRDPYNKTDMASRIPKTEEILIQAKELGLVADIKPWLNILASSTSLKVGDFPTMIHGDFNFRHLLLDKQQRLAAVIDWGDMQISTPATDLHIFWSLIPPPERSRFLQYYGAVPDTELKIARVIAIFLAATLAVYGHKIGAPAIAREGLQGLHYTAQA